MQSKSIPAPTKAERQWMGKIVAYGCCACRSDTGKDWLRPVEVHHLLDGGVRIGHHATVALCQFHHRGIPPEGFNVKTATAKFGPSLFHNGRAFRARYGDDKALRAFQEYLLTLPIPGEE